MSFTKLSRRADKVRRCCIVLNDLHLTAMGCHCGITLCYLPPNTNEHTPPDRSVLNLPILQGWKAELT